MLLDCCMICYHMYVTVGWLVGRSWCVHPHPSLGWSPFSLVATTSPGCTTSPGLLCLRWWWWHCAILSKSIDWVGLGWDEWWYRNFVHSKTPTTTSATTTVYKILECIMYYTTGHRQMLTINMYMIMHVKKHLHVVFGWDWLHLHIWSSLQGKIWLKVSLITKKQGNRPVMI